jgi:hypothetical protein
MNKKEEGEKVIIKLFVYSSLFFCYSVSDRASSCIWIRRNSIIKERYVCRLLQNARILGTENYHGFILMVDREVFIKLYQLMNIGVRCYMSELMDLNEIAKKIAELRREKILKPTGYFDNKGRWYPDKAVEQASCCSHIRPPSAAHPYSYLYHARTVKHIETLLREKPYAISWIAYNSDLSTLDCNGLKPDMSEEVLKQYEDKYSEFLEYMTKIRSLYRNKYSEFMEYMTRIRSLYRIEHVIVERLFEEIKYMVPLSSKKVEVAQIDMNDADEHPYGKLYVREWLSIDYGGRLNRVTADIIVPVLQWYGDTIAEHVYEHKRKDFKKIVMLVKQFKEYPNEYIDKEKGIKIDMEYLRFESSHKLPLSYYPVFDRQTLESLDESTLNALVHAAAQLEITIIDINTNNNRIIEEIGKIVKPYRVSRDLCK